MRVTSNATHHAKPWEAWHLCLNLTRAKGTLNCCSDFCREQGLGRLSGRNDPAQPYLVNHDHINTGCRKRTGTYPDLHLLRGTAKWTWQSLSSESAHVVETDAEGRLLSVLLVLQLPHPKRLARTA